MGHHAGRDLADGMFGENLTTQGLDVDGAVVGERWRVGSAVLEVSGPRIPCATFAAWMGERGWVRRFTERGRTGAYLAVVEPGLVSTGDGVEVLGRPSHGITVPEVFRAYTGDDALADRVLAEGILEGEDRVWLERRMARRRGKIDQ